MRREVQRELERWENESYLDSIELDSIDLELCQGQLTEPRVLAFERQLARERRQVESSLRALDRRRK